jgi:hypothetical protein
MNTAASLAKGFERIRWPFLVEQLLLVRARQRTFMAPANGPAVQGMEGSAKACEP